MDKTSKILIVVGVVIIVIGLLGAATFVFKGAKHFGGKSEFGMMGRGEGNVGMLKGGEFGNERMAFGRLSGDITAISGSSITIKDSAGDEISIAISDTTSIYNQGKIAKAADLKVNNSVLISGRPNSSGIVQATAIYIR
jgi:hypothetical protein